MNAYKFDCPNFKIVLPKIKSYESISSLSSDCARPSSQNQMAEGEPFYDTVPMEQNDGGEYVYVQAGGNGTVSSNEGRRKRLGRADGNGSSSSRDDLSNAGSTLPMSAAVAANQNRLSASSNLRSSAQLQQFEPESPGRNSNYVNIDYFISHAGREETRSSSIDSDGEGDVANVPVLLRAISQDDQLIPNTPGAFRKLPVR